MNWLRYAWRNLWRNGKRTGITLAAVALNTAVLIVSYGLMQGMIDGMVRNATNLVAGDAQAHARDYLADRSFYKSIDDPEAILAAARRAGVAAAARSYGYGLVSSGTKSAGAMFWGVDPAAERVAFDLARQVDRGGFLADGATGRLVLGRKLAKSLHADVGSQIVAVVEAADGSLGNEIFEVAGILKLSGEEIDRMAAILDRGDFDRLFVSAGRIQEIALNSRGKLTAEQVAGTVAGLDPGLEVKTWRELMPQLGDLVYIYEASLWLFALIFFLAAGIGVMNTMLMATYERIHEFGILKAIGATPWRIVRDVAAEALVLGLVATAAGLVIGTAGAAYFRARGLDLTVFISGNISFAGISFDPLWRATLGPRVILLPVAIMWVVCVLASLYPAVKAARLDPVKAMTHV